MRDIQPSPAVCTRRSARRQSGFTLLEVMAAIGLAVPLILVAGKSFLESSRAYTGLASLSFTRTRAQVLMDSLVPALTIGSFSSLSPPLPVNASAIEFKKVIDVVDGDPVLGNTWHIDLVPRESDTTDSKDNDRDGLIDEGALRIWEDLAPYGPTPDPTDRVMIVSECLARDGLKFTRAGAALNVELTLQTIVDRGQPPRTLRVVSGVKMRNN